MKDMTKNERKRYGANYLINKSIQKRTKFSCNEKAESLCSELKFKDNDKVVVTNDDMKAFFRLLEKDEKIEEFLSRDQCCRVTDKYLLAMVFVYFKRAGLKKREFTRMNFFNALYLAHDIEEDEEEIKYEIFPWALGSKWKDKYHIFLLLRDRLWCSMDHRAIVSRRCCEEVMSIDPNHKLWKRQRKEYHGGASRNYMRPSEEELIPRGPFLSPFSCLQCKLFKEKNLHEIALTCNKFTLRNGLVPKTAIVYAKEKEEGLQQRIRNKSKDWKSKAED